MHFPTRRRLFASALSALIFSLGVSHAAAQCGSGRGTRMPPSSMAQTPFGPQFAMPFPNPQQYLMQQQLLVQQQLQLQLMLQQQYALQKLAQKQNPQTALQDLLRQLSTASESRVQQALESDQPLERLAGAAVAGPRSLPLQKDLISLIQDPSDLVRQTARRSLILLSAVEAKRTSTSSRSARSIDFGPAANASPSAQRNAARKWQEWWDKRT